MYLSGTVKSRVFEHLSFQMCLSAAENSQTAQKSSLMTSLLTSKRLLLYMSLAEARAKIVLKQLRL